MSERIIEFEGRRIAVPPDATDAEIEQILGGGGAVAPAAPAAPPQTLRLDATPPVSVGQYAGETVGQGARGMRRGIANVVGLPVDLVTAGMNFLPGVNIQQPVGGSDWIDRALGGFGAVPEMPAPRDPLQRGVRRIGEEVGAAAVPVAGAAGAVARTGATSAAAVRQAMPGVFGRYFVEPYAADPTRFIRQQGGLALGAGTGAALVNEVTGAAGYDRSTPIGQVGDIAGSLAGGIATNLGAGTLGAAGNTLRMVRGGAANYADRVSDQTAAEILAGYYGARGTNVAPNSSNPIVASVQRAANWAWPQPGNYDDLVAAIERGAFSPTEAALRGPRANSVIPGFQETLPDRLPSPTIAAAAYSRAAGPRADAFNARNASNAEAVDGALQALAPQGQPGAFVDAVRRVRDARITGAEDAANQAALDADQILQRLSPSMTPEQRGAMIRTALQNAEDTAQAGVRAAYANADTSRVTVDPAALNRAVEGVSSGLTQVERGLAPQGVLNRVAPPVTQAPPAPPVSTGILDPITGQPITRPAPQPDPPAPVPFAELDTLRSELLRLQRAALADPRAESGGANAARVIGRYVTAIEDLMQQSLPPDLAANLQAARGAAFQRAESFGRRGDPVAQALANREGGRPAVPDQNVPGLFVSPRADQPLQRLLAEADTPQVRSAIRDELLARANASTARADTVRDFVDQYGAALGRFPGLADELRQAATAREGALAARGQADTLRRDLTTPSRSAIAGVAEFGPERARDAMARVIASSDPRAATDEVLAAIGGDQAALDGARRAFWDLMEQRSRSRGETTATARGVQPWMGQKLQSVLQDPGSRAVLERLYANQPEHVQRLDEIAQVLTTVNQTSRGRAGNASGTGQSVAGASRNILTPEAVMSRVYAFQTGRISSQFLVGSILGTAYRAAMRVGRTAAVQNAVDEALLNPEFAKALLERGNPANIAAMRRMVSGANMNRLSEFTRLLDADEDPVANAVQENSR